MNVIFDRDYKESGVYAKEQAEVQTVPVYCKVALTIKEAAEYSNIGINKLECLLRSPRCPFVLYVGNKKLGSHWRYVFTISRRYRWSGTCIEKSEDFLFRSVRRGRA